MYKHVERNNQVMQIGTDGFYQLEKDKEAIELFVEEVRERRMKFDSIQERLEWLVENKYYYDLFEDYTLDQAIELTMYADSFNFKFASYMAITKFFKDYALKTNDKRMYLEDYAEHNVIVAMYLAKGNFEMAKELVAAMMEQRYQAATPTYMNAGRARRGEMVSCFLLGIDDSLNGIQFAKSNASQLSKLGGGVALDASRLRARGGSIKGIEGVAKGVLPVAKMLEGEFSYADQLGQRPGAGAVYVNIFHYDSLELIGSKKINADDDARLSTLSIGLTIPDKFFELAEKGDMVYMFDPHTVKQEYGVDLQDIDLDKYYEDMKRNPNVRKKSTDAREYLSTIAKTQIESGYPYIVFKDNANRSHELKDIGTIQMSNLCTEIFNLMDEHTITDYGQEDVIGRDISCNLGSLNIANVMETKKLRSTVHIGIDALTSVTDGTSIANAPGVKKANDELHSIGLGAMNLHGYLAKNLIPYESEEAKDFVNVFFAAVRYYSIERSMLIAKERGIKFKDFDKSEYAKGTTFDKYIVDDIVPTTTKVLELFDGVELPSTEDWKALKDDVKKYGMYHAYLSAIAPKQLGR